MTLIRNFKEKLGKIKSSLTSLDNQPLSKATLMILLFLDIFILTTIFNGLAAHTRQLSTALDELINSTPTVAALWACGAEQAKQSC